MAASRTEMYLQSIAKPQHQIIINLWLQKLPDQKVELQKKESTGLLRTKAEVVVIRIEFAAASLHRKDLSQVIGLPIIRKLEWWYSSQTLA